MKAVLLAAGLAAALAGPASANTPIMNWIEANSDLTCSNEVQVEWVGQRRLRELSPRATLGVLIDGVAYVRADKQSDRRKRTPIVVHEQVHQCQEDSGLFVENTLENCLEAETQAHDMDELWRTQRGLKFEPARADFILKKCFAGVY